MGDIKFSNIQSYAIYFSSIFISTFFASLSNKYAIKSKDQSYKVNRVFWSMSFIALFLPAAFRGYGVDHQGYLDMYDYVKQYGASFFLHYSGMPEPLYALMNYIVINTVDKFQYIYCISAFITLFFTYLGFSRYVKKINLGICVFAFGFTYYLFIFGLVRISIAVGIIIYAYRFLETKKIIPYILCCIFAASFHYSALIMIPVYIIVNISRRKKLTDKQQLFFIFSICIIIPISFALIKVLVPILLGGFVWFPRYHSYFQTVVNWKTLINVACMFPLAIVIFFWGRKISKTFEYGNLYIRLFYIMISFIFASMFFPIHRVTYYLYPACIYLYAMFPKLSIKRENKLKIMPLYYYGLFLFGILWIIRAFFIEKLWAPFLIPYYFNLP